MRSSAIDYGGNDGIVNAGAGEVGHVNHGADASDCNICFRFVSIGYVHVALRTSGEVVGVLFVDHGCILLEKE
jgi:hypothetical protein